MTMLFQTVRQGSQKARIWQICDDLARASGRPPHGPEVVARYTAEGGNPSTGQTQYSKWRKAFFAREKAAADLDVDGLPGAGSVGFMPITIGPEGHVVLPKEVLRAMMLDADGRATVCVVDGEVRIISPLAALHALQDRMKGLAPGDRLVSEELIAERRAEALSE